MRSRFAAIAVFLGIAATVRAVDTAYWTEYAADPKDDALFLLMPFTEDLKKAAGPVASVEAVGDAAHAPDGKFGGALRLGGRGALKVTPSGIFPGGHLMVEAWVRLDRYPEKQAFIVFRPGETDHHPQYDPAVDVTKGFSLAVDAKGALHLETRNCFYGSTTRTSSPPGALPPGRWVHVAAVSAGFPVSFRRIFADGKEVAAVPIAWGQGLVVSGDEEKKPGPLYVGNSDKGDAGLSGRIDQLRIHRRVFRFQPKEDDSWTASATRRAIPAGPPNFCAEHAPALYLPLDGDAKPALGSVDGLKVDAAGGRWVPGVRGQALLGKLGLSAPKLLGLDEGSIEFWFQPAGVNSCSDRNVTFLSTSAFQLYFLNSENPNGVPLTLYFDKGGGMGLHFVHDKSGTLYFPGTWYHAVVSWKRKDIILYLDGREVGRSCGEPLARPHNKGVLNQAAFIPHGAVGAVDEVYLYDKALLPEEAANAHARYRDPGKLRGGVRLPPVEVKGQYHPYANRIYTLLEPNVPADGISKVRLELRDKGGRVLFRNEGPFSAEERPFEVPPLEEGTYALSGTATVAGGKEEPGVPFVFVRKKFAWERNRIGVTDEIFPPFTAVKVEGRTFGVVGRSHTMNGFGLWDRVETKGRDILAAPLALRYATAAGEGAWAKVEGKWRSTAPKLAVWEAEAAADPVAVRTVSSVEVDGCMKVEMELRPGPKPGEVRDLWVEIPLKEAEAPLMHAIADGLRQNPAGFVPKGQGVVWDGGKAARSPSWRNLFVPYVWLGAEERGLAWFGENDKGWVTEKGKSKAPILEVVRDPGRVVLRVHLVNTPVTLKEPRRIVFGLQASPTKPMPEGWRKRLPDMPGGLAVVPFGGLQCASQGPYRDDWRIVDRILECRAGKEFDRKWFEDYVKEHKPPLVHGNWDWLGSVEHFAQRAKGIGPNRPLTVYQEEMFAAVPRPEWIVFQDEWCGLEDAWARQAPGQASMDTGYAFVGENAGVTFGESYRDFGTFFADEWLKRGVSLYWDNVFPKLSTNFRTTDAYRTEDGQVQPALLLWSQREYQKRVWHALQERRKTRPEPLEWLLHMTNTMVLPIVTWGTIDLDHELGNDKPFAPDWLRTETIGLQAGNYPLSLYAVTGDHNKVFAELRKTKPKAEVDRMTERSEWGMRMVHEIQHSGGPEKVVKDFGYGEDAVVVHNYWADRPALRVANDEVKWIVLERKDRPELLMIFASWSDRDAETAVSFLPGALGFGPAGLKMSDAEGGAAASFPLALPGPYGVRLIRAGK
jgi:hypothetical protein